MVLEAAFRWSKKKTDTVHANVLTAYELHQVTSDSISLFWGGGGGKSGKKLYTRSLLYFHPQIKKELLLSDLCLKGVQEFTNDMPTW